MRTEAVRQRGKKEPWLLGLRELPRDWRVKSSIPVGDAFDTKTDQELFKGWWFE
jgi:hypothetical protein